jgi:gelsolin
VGRRRTDRRPDWQDTNVGLIGSDIDRKCKEAAANGEPQWD